MSWRVRTAHAAELPLLPVVERAAARLFPIGRIPDPDAAHGVDELRGYLEEGLLWVAAGDERVLGYLMARPLDGALHIYEVAVDPDVGRRGIGTALMQRALEESIVRALPRVTLTTFEDLPWNAPFYQRLGFRVLPDHELTEPLRRILEREREVGMVRRVAMTYAVGACR